MKNLLPRPHPLFVAIAVLATAGCEHPRVDTRPKAPPVESASPAAPSTAPEPAVAVPAASSIRITPLGSTHEGHAVTRGHNRKFFLSAGWSYVVWIEQLGSLGDYHPQYRASKDLREWTPQRPLSDVRNGGASGIDYEVLPSTAQGDGRVAGLESRYDEGLKRAAQYVRLYSAREGVLAPLGPPVTVGVDGDAKAPSGYGSIARDDEGVLWVAERDERGVAGHGENALLLYRARIDPAAGDRVAFDPEVMRPFESEAPPRPGVTRAARVLCHGPWVVLVAYVEEPDSGESHRAALYVRAYDRKQKTWTKTVAIARPGAIVADEPRVAPDVRPSAWIGRDGRLAVSWMPAADLRAVVVTTMAAPYDVAPEPASALRTTEGRRPISAQLRIDSRFTPARAYLFAIDAKTGAALPRELAPAFLFTRFDGRAWEPAETIPHAGAPCLYLGMAQPELLRDGDPLVALTQDARGADLQIRLIDASGRKYAPRP
jgi:hypothetical protein